MKTKHSYKDCRHAEREGQYAVFVAPGCRMAHMIKGILVTSKQQCRDCRFWEPREGEADEEA